LDVGPEPFGDHPDRDDDDDDAVDHRRDVERPSLARFRERCDWPRGQRP
jgi:hypothetical protein